VVRQEARPGLCESAKGMKDTGIPDQETETGGPDPVQESGGSVITKEERLAHFIRMLSDDDENSRWKAAESRGRLRDPGAVDPLIDTLRDDDSRMRLKSHPGSWPDRGYTGNRSTPACIQYGKRGISGDYHQRD